MSTAWESDEQQIDYRKRSRKRKVDQFSSDPAIDTKIKEHVCPGLLPSTQRLLLELSDDEDKELVADFANYAYHATRGIATNTKRAYIANLVYLSKYVKEKRNNGIYKRFREMTGDDVAGEKSYLASLKKTPEEDPDERWINTHNNRGQVYSKFFKWLYNDPKTKPEDRKAPPVVEGIIWRRKRKENRDPRKKEKDDWTPEEHAVFLKRCEDPRLACFHAMARDLGGRPDELLALKMETST
jgi:hypothetical protein